jgi:hypothetical protein
MAALLEVAPPLVDEVGPAAVYVGLAFGVCAGSSLLLTAATSGPLAQRWSRGPACVTSTDGDSA